MQRKDSKMFSEIEHDGLPFTDHYNLEPEETFKNYLDLCSSECGSQTSSTSITWNLVRCAESQSPPRCIEAESVFKQSQVIRMHDKVCKGQT